VVIDGPAKKSPHGKLLYEIKSCFLGYRRVAQDSPGMASEKARSHCKEPVTSSKEIRPLIARLDGARHVADRCSALDAKPSKSKTDASLEVLLRGEGRDSV
jgi:hypothetical protein